MAREFGAAVASDDWQTVILAPAIEAVVIAVPPRLQPQMIKLALEANKAVFAEKPLALDYVTAAALAHSANERGLPNMVDFGFGELPAFQAAKRMLQAGEIGKLKSVFVHWTTESRSNRFRASGWKADGNEGGGALLNFVSHMVHYLNALCGPIAEVECLLGNTLANDPSRETMAAMLLRFADGTVGSLIFCNASAPGQGHRIEVNGASGSLLLDNSGGDYFDGFKLYTATSPDGGFQLLEEGDLGLGDADGRLYPAGRLWSRFSAWASAGIPSRPDFNDAARVQAVLDAARAAHLSGARQGIP